MAPSKPTIYYFPIRGRAEVLKMALAAKGIEFDVQDVVYQEMKTDLKTYRFGQCPRYADADVDLCQSNAILRHIGRKYGMYGSTLAEAALVDEVLDGVEDLRRKYVELIYVGQLSDEAKAAYVATHVDKASAAGQRNGGAHLAYLAGCVAANPAGTSSGWAVGADVSVADVALAEIVDLHERILPKEMAESYPELPQLKQKVEALPGVKSYIASPLRLDKVNNNSLG